MQIRYREGVGSPVWTLLALTLAKADLFSSGPYDPIRDPEKRCARRHDWFARSIFREPHFFLAKREIKKA
jgi:hypothetical protein